MNGSMPFPADKLTILDAFLGELEVHGLIPTSNCLDELRNLASNAEAAVVEGQESRRDEALDAARLLIREMVSLAKHRGRHALESATLREALRSLCPIWPFC